MSNIWLLLTNSYLHLHLVGILSWGPRLGRNTKRAKRVLCPEGAPNHERTQRDIYGKQGWIIIKDPVIIIIKQVIITIKNLVIIISKVGLD